MKRMSRLIGTLALLLTSLGAVSAADAANLKALGPVSPAHGYPVWYQDTNNLALELCLDQNGFCLLPGAFVFPASRTAINTGNFPDESFYYMADTSGVSPGGVISLTLYEAAVEAGFTLNVVDGQQATFTRIRIRANVTVPGQYVVTHPYGVETFQVDAIVPGPEINFTEDIPGLVVLPFDQAHQSLTSRVGPFLTRADGTFVTDPVSGNRYIGVPGAQVAVTGAPTGNNFVQIVGGGDTLRLNTFGLMGKVIGLDVQPSTALNLGATNIVTPAAIPKAVTVTNTTGNPITFAADLNAVGVKAGADAADFIVGPPAAAGTADCAGATVAAGASCSFNIVFMPAAVPKAARAATILLAPTSVQPPAPAPAVTDPPPVSMKLSGTAQVTVTAVGKGHGSITPEAQEVDAGTNVTFTVAPGNLKFKVKEVADGPALVTGPPFTINAGTANHAVTASFMASGDLDANGKLEIADAFKALKIVAGIQAADGDDPDNTAVNVAPLVGGIPAPDNNVNIGDVLVILRRVLNLEKW